MSAHTAGARTSTDGADDLATVDAFWRAANYLSVGQIYLMADPLLDEPLQPEHIKPRLLGHWGTTPGLNFVWAHLNRVIVRDEQDTLMITGPGHGGPGVVASAWLEGSYTERWTHVSRDAEGMAELFRQFSFPGGIPSHAAPQTPGSINEGGELGYSLAHAYGAAFDNPDLLVTCVIGDGEAETGALAGSWQSNAFLHPVHDGTVLPILHLNGYKIANSTVPARIPAEDLQSLLEGHGHRPYLVEGGFDGEDPAAVHDRMASTLDEITGEIRRIRSRAAAQHAAGQQVERPRWPMLVLRTPKGWTGPTEVDGRQVEGLWRSHQVPLPGVREDPEHRAQLERWLRSYRPEELFDDDGRPREHVSAHVPAGERRMSATPHSNGGELLRDLRLPPTADHAVEVPAPGAVSASATGTLGGWLAEVVRRNPETFRIMGPDETVSNKLQDVFTATDRQFLGRLEDTDEHVAPHGRVLEVLNEQLCQGWLEGYLLSGRHGLFNCYEAFVHIVDSMFNQHAKWLEESRRIPWRRPVASLNYLLTSHVWRQDHNGFSHQDPGFLDHVLNKKPEIVRAYLPPDANTLLATMEHCLASRDLVNVVVAGKNEQPQWLGPHEARAHCVRGIGYWDWASTDTGSEPDVVLGCAGDVPTIETLAAAGLLRTHLPELKVRVVNVVDLMRLQDERAHPHGLSDREFDGLFTTDKPVIFAYHGYPWMIHRLTYRRTNHADIHVRGFIEEGTTTTPFDMVMLNELDRFHLVIDVIDRVPGLAVAQSALRRHMVDERLRCRDHTRRTGTDAPDVADWTWQGA
ncbi:phosphoketolase family protein [Pseudonocardia parietis]|uniref:Probable phosphoketolase n=1 Tax=Pseudonocardia parietis TaxID=570936 RepID=A0ABS4VKV8_9PSEU|nr:phosphoketolase family protein [Pseudonocardia parietis]MBP2364552.1 xylulose-5-phosphate/fructose-6-phosphate phosphoketolase [Pseudonocardia parietis]